MVTLTGPGGVGKTRLALQVVRALDGEFADGAVFVGLADLREPALLGGTITDRLRLGSHSAQASTTQLIDHLGNRRLLLVLDNCEHLVGECARLVGKNHGGNDVDFLFPRFDTVKLGWQLYQPNAGSYDLWLDDIALSAERIGC